MFKYSRAILIFACIFYSYHILPFNFINHKIQEGPLKPTFWQELLLSFHPDVLVETGTYNGKNSLIASPYFTEVHTIELSKNLFNEAKKNIGTTKNIYQYFGSSPKVLSTLIPQLKGRIMFWLDAHACGGATAYSNDNMNDPDAITAIREELRSIKNSGITDCIILIDDIRIFGSLINQVEYLSCWAYPSIQEVCNLAKEINSNFEFALIGDILMMYDRTLFTPKLSAVVAACTASRLYDGKNLSDEELLSCEEIIMGASGEEKAFIQSLYLNTTTLNDPFFHHDLWYALVAMGEENWKEALLALSKISMRIEYTNKRNEKVHISREYKHWRLDYYKNLILQRSSSV